MKIDFLITSLGGGGAERVVCNLSNYLTENGDEVTIAAIRGKDNSYFISDLVNVKYLQPDYYERKINIKSRLSEIRSVNHYLKTLNDDSLLVCFLELPVAYALCMRSSFRCPLVICERNNPLFYSNNYQRLYRFFSKRADGCVCQTSEIAQWYKPIIGNKCKLTIIPNSINASVLNAPVSTRQSKRIVSMARLTPQKNQKMLIDAFAAIHKEHPEYTLEIYGEGPLREDLESQIKALGITDFVALPGFVRDVIEVFRDANIFVMTSDHEGMPNALAEAMAMGIPCISTDCGGGGARELIMSGNNGILIPCRDVQSLIRNMNLVIEDIQMAENLSKNAIGLRKRLDPNLIHVQWKLFFKLIK